MRHILGRVSIDPAAERAEHEAAMTVVRRHAEHQPHLVLGRVAFAIPLEDVLPASQAAVSRPVCLLSRNGKRIGIRNMEGVHGWVSESGGGGGGKEWEATQLADVEQPVAALHVFTNDEHVGAIHGPVRERVVSVVQALEQRAAIAEGFFLSEGAVQPSSAWFLLGRVVENHGSPIMQLLCSAIVSGLMVTQANSNGGVDGVIVDDFDRCWLGKVGTFLGIKAGKPPESVFGGVFCFPGSAQRVQQCG